MEQSLRLSTSIDADSVASPADTVLVKAAQVEPQVFGELYRRYLERVYRYLRARVSSDEDAADLTQQVFLQAMNALPRYHQQSVSFATWLFRIAHNIAIDSHRRQQPISSLEDMLYEFSITDTGNPEAVVLQQESLERLRLILSNLDMHKRELLALRFAAGLTAREIALVVGKSEAAVKKQLTRTVRALKEQYTQP